MKKRIITLLAVLALLVTCAVFAVQAENEYTSAITWTANCPCGCGVTLQNVTWTTWEEGMEWAADGHYLVTGATFTASPAWGTSNLTILLRSTDDPTVDPEPVTMTMDAKAQFNGGSFITKKVSIIGEKATIQSQLANSNGGMFRTASGGILTIRGDVTLKGTEGNTGAGNNGGLIGAFAGKVDLDGVTMYQPAAKDGGGCIFVNTATVTANDCTFIGTGKSAPKGGAVRVNSSGSLTMEDCTVENTKAATGGFAYVAAGTLTVRNTTVTGCDATTGADNIYMAGGTVYMQGASITTGANGTRGNGVWIDGGTLRLHQKSNIVGPDGDYKLKGNIAIDTSKSGVIEVSTGWTGTASLQTFNTTDGTINIRPGVTMSASKFKVISWDSTNSKWVTYTTNSNTATSARLWAENEDALCPRINFYNQWFLPFRATVMDKDNNVVEWKLTAQEAIAAAAAENAETGSQGGYYAQMQCDYNIEMSSSATQLTTGVLDLNGWDLTGLGAKAGSQLTLIDSKAAAGEAGGTVALTAANDSKNNVAAADVIQTGIFTVGDKVYVTTLGETVATVYPVTFEITSVSLRPTATKASLYYTATVKAHEDAGLDAWGVAVTLDETTTELADHMFTTETEANGTEYNGVLLNGIAATDGEDNADRADRMIYAKAYITVDGETVMSATVSKTLNDIVKDVMALDESELTDAQKISRETMQTYGWYTELYAN